VHNIPEYHDCQRFLLEGAGAREPFGSLYAIFATNPTTLGRVPTLAAQIWTPDGYYSPLDLKPGFNCLYLWGASPSWHARILWSGTQADRCKATLPSLTIDERLMVIRTGSSTDPADYPPSARWEWAPAIGEYRIGLSADTAWLEIGRRLPDSMSVMDVSTRAHSLGSAIGSGDPWSGEQLKRAVIKGWYDEQILDLYDTTTNGLVSTGIRGFAVPDWGIVRTEMVDDYRDWYRSAYVYLEPVDQIHPDAFQKYREKMNFGRTQWDDPNIVDLCLQKASGDCDVALDTLPNLQCEQEEGSGTWLARITNADTDLAEIRCVVRCGHEGTPVPATARWRGVEKDAKLWMRCAQGCCTVQ
jgi:hypothetical protein